MRKFNLLITISLIIEAICYFLPFCLACEWWGFEASRSHLEVSDLSRYDEYGNIFSINTNLSKILAIALVSVTVLTAVFYLIRTIKNNAATYIKELIFLLIHTAVMVGFLVYSFSITEIDEMLYEYREYTFGWLFYVIIILNIISIALTIILKSGKFTPVHKEAAPSPAQQDNSINKIKEYKELFESDIITEDEFEEKKKQILGL